MMDEKAWKGPPMDDMKLKLGFRIGEEKRESEETTLPPIDVRTWQSPYIFPRLCYV